MRAIITVTSIDTVGIIAKVATYLAHHGVNILDISQSTMREFFTMIMLVDTEKCTVPYIQFADGLVAMGEENGLKIHLQLEDIFNTMHRI